MPIGIAQEVTVNEGFADSTYEAGLTVSGGTIYCDEQNQYGTTGCSLLLSNGTYTFTFSSDIYVYEVGFIVGGVNNAYSVKYYYSDGTDETINKSGQDISNFSTMYDDFYKSFTDYNNSNEISSEIYITKFDVVVSDASLFDTLYWQYDDADATGSFGTTTTTTIPLTIGDPTNLTVSANLHNGSITVDWDAPTDGGYSPERYAIGFDKADPPMYAVATGNVGDENALNTEYTFTKSYLQAALDAQVGDTLYFKIRSDNDTNSLYSSWTTIASYTIQNAPSGVTDVLITNNEYQGLKIGWVQPNTGWGTVSSYTISYKLSSEETYTDIENIDVNATSYLIEDIQGGTYDFVIYACSSTGWCHGGQAGPITNYEVLSTTTTTTTTTTTLPPPPPPAPEPEPEPEKIVVGMDDGTKAEYTEAQIADGTSDRDKERNANEDKWGCYVTNAALERGDCEAYNKALYESTTTTTIPDKIEEEIKDEEIIDTKPDIVDEEIVEDELVEDGFEQIETDSSFSEEGDKEIQPEELVDEKDEIKITTTTTVPKNTTTTTQPIKEDFVDEDIIEEEILDIEVVISEELTEEEVEVLVKETEAKVKEVVVIEIVEDEPIEEFEAKVEQAVKELPKEKKVEVVKEVAKVSVQNLSTADNTTKAVVKAVVKEVTKTETVAQLSEEEKKDVGKVLGFQDESAADDVEIIAVQAEKEPAIAEAVAEYVDRAIENKDVENYTLADVITEIQVEAFLDNPIGSLFDVKIDELDISSLGDDMTSDQKEKAQEVVVPVILASQIISSAGALMRRF